MKFIGLRFLLTQRFSEKKDLYFWVKKYHLFDKTPLKNREIGELKTINAISPKRWKTYSIHLIETVVNIVNSPFDPVKYCSYRNRLGGEILYLRFPEGP